MSFFGSSATTSKPSFGFGTNTTSSGTGFSFGTAKTSAPTFSFGSGATNTSSGFGTTTTSAPSSGFSFGTSTGFGSTATSTGTTGFGFGANKGLGTTASTGTTGFGFGSGLGGFGATKTTASSLFGGGFGSTTTTSAGTGFGFGTGTTGGFGGFGTGLATQQQQQQQQQLQQQQQQQGVDGNLLNIASALSMPVIYGDERDVIIAKWNQIQAFWGTGKGYFNQQNAVEFNPENPFCRFKTVGYTVKPSTRDEDGMIILHFKKKESEIRSQQQQLVDSLFRILGSNQGLSVCVEDVRSLPDGKTEVVIYVLERSATGLSKRIAASQLYTHLSQNHIKTQLGQLGVVEMVPKLSVSGAQLDAYLNNSPLGYDPRLWRQARLDNPDPESLIPVPMVGFHTLKSRLENQEQQTKQQQARLDLISKDIETLQHNQDTIHAKIAEYKRRHQELSHRALQVMTRQEVQRKLGIAIQIEEEQLHTNLETVQAELNAPAQMKGRLNEMMSQVRLHSHVGGRRGDEQYQISPELQQEIRQHLKQQQEGLGHLINTIKDDLEDLKLIETGLEEASLVR